MSKSINHNLDNVIHNAQQNKMDEALIDLAFVMQYLTTMLNFRYPDKSRYDSLNLIWNSMIKKAKAKKINSAIEDFAHGLGIIIRVLEDKDCIREPQDMH